MNANIKHETLKYRHCLTPPRLPPPATRRAAPQPRLRAAPFAPRSACAARPEAAHDRSHVKLETKSEFVISPCLATCWTDSSLPLEKRERNVIKKCENLRKVAGKRQKTEREKLRKVRPHYDEDPSLHIAVLDHATHTPLRMPPCRSAMVFSSSPSRSGRWSAAARLAPFGVFPTMLSSCERKHQT